MEPNENDEIIAEEISVQIDWCYNIVFIIYTKFTRE